MLTETDAQRLTTRIQLRLQTVAENAEAVVDLIKQARDGEAHVALGFASWTRYVTETFGDSLARLERAQRVELSTILVDQGMSIRAISAVTGVSKSTVSNDVSSSGHVPTETTIGTDGKVYPRQERQQRRRPLPDAYRDALYDLDKVLNKLRRLHEDDRFDSNRPGLNDHHWREIGRAETLLMDLNADLTCTTRISCSACGEPRLPSCEDSLCRDCRRAKDPQVIDP